MIATFEVNFTTHSFVTNICLMNVNFNELFCKAPFTKKFYFFSHTDIQDLEQDLELFSSVEVYLINK